MTMVEKIHILTRPSETVKFRRPFAAEIIDSTTGLVEKTITLKPGEYTIYFNLDIAETDQIRRFVEDPLTTNRLLRLPMSPLEEIMTVLPRLPRVTINVHQKMVLTNSMTGHQATIHAGRRTFVVARRDKVLWIFWLSGINQGRLVGLSVPFFTVQFEDRHVATIESMPDLQAVA